MSRLKKIINFFSETVEVEDERDEEKERLKKELMEESKKYEKKEQATQPNKDLEAVPKQVLFVDEDFVRKQNEPVEKEKFTDAPKYNTDTPKFKPSNYISPVHGLIKEAEKVEVKEHEVKTTSESDYSIIREKILKDASKSSTIEQKDELEDSSSFKIFKTSEIINISKRVQIDESEIYDENTSIEDAYSNAEEDNYVDVKSFNAKREEQSDLFDLLDELKEEDNE